MKNHFGLSFNETIIAGALIAVVLIILQHV